MRGGLESDPWGLPALLAGDGAVGVDVCGGLRVGGLELLGARAYDPTGLKPLTDAELNAYTDAHTGWHAGWNWLRKNKDYIFGGAMVIAGGIMAATPGWQVAGGMLMGAGFDTLTQRATTGSVNYGKVVVSGLLGAAGGAGGSALVGRLGLSGIYSTVTVSAASEALPGGVMGGYNYMSGPGPHTPAGFLQATATGTLKGGVTGGLGGAAGHGLSHVFGNAIGRSVMADPKILSGHGEISASNSSAFIVPKGVRVRFYSPHGTIIDDDLGNAIETGARRWPFSSTQPTPYEVAGPGAIVPDYRLFPLTMPPVLNIKGTPITVTDTSGVRLSDLIEKGGVGVYDWAACREVVGD